MLRCDHGSEMTEVHTHQQVQDRVCLIISCYYGKINQLDYLGLVDTEGVHAW